MTQFPPMATDVFAGVKAGVVVNPEDTAKMLVSRGRFRQPSLSAAGRVFIWPGGTEGIKISGQATVAEHRYFDENKVVIQVVHRDSRRIVMTGMFSGATASANWRDLLDIITAEQPPNGKLLSVPGVFLKAQRVAVADYEFDHNEDDRTDSFTYSVNFHFLGVGSKLKQAKTISFTRGLLPVSGAKPDRGKSERVFIVRDGAGTLRAVAKIVYGNANRWREIYNKNSKVLNTLNVQLHVLPTKPLPHGLRLKY